ncbi:hypothetical protein PV692_08840 [Streptomyces sp. AK04-4c]|uniref:hypothetical protein n=1 Tax=Streptomyces sp. AK04-4c TaxID=3028651 RepID=UPI0029BC26D1|nr:hypothetical protein [Streptomyces sp. AK04-4c]MDX3683693.1 hypothetical protein [Streptomyces sp. AK04-4c]
MGYDLFGDPYFEDDVAVPEPEQLREFTPQTLPKRFRTWQQIRDVGLESVGPPVGLLSWTPSGACAPKTAKVYDISKARKAGPPPGNPTYLSSSRKPKSRNRWPQLAESDECIR